jgi:iron complex outermembrane recepter protein
MTIKQARIVITSSIVCCCIHLSAQNDSILLPEVPVSVYPAIKPQWIMCNSVSKIDSGMLGKQPGQSLVPALNSIAGVRMEERSPASYRLSIRGSLLRSPFGVRNIKVYLDDLPLTNAGGETYLNLIDQNSINSVEVVKGPDGSMFGANTGGVVKINSANLRDTNSFIVLSAGAGSFGLKQQFLKVQQTNGRNTFNINQGWQQSNGFRKNSAMDRKYLQLSDQYNYLNKGQLRLLFFLSDLNYQTPGGLTASQFTTDPSMARPSTSSLPGAEAQKAGIHNRTFFGGITNEVKIGKGIKHGISFFGSNTDFRNPFITNFETRKENNFGSRTWLEFKNELEDEVNFTWTVGAEEQSMISRIVNYGNRGGVTDTVQANDKAMATYGFLFTNCNFNFYNKIIVEASLSYNSNL